MKTFTRSELNDMARDRGIRGFSRMRKRKLTEKLGIVLPKWRLQLL